MSRICPLCNRPKDEDHHDLVEVPILDEISGGITGWRKAPPGWPNRYACRVKLVATSPTTGKTLTPADPQRIAELDTRYVHVDTLAAQEAARG